jgi:VWFA-related protein
MNVSCRTGAVLLSALLALPLFAQQTAQQEAGAAPTADRHIVFDVVVQDRSKKPVAGLQAQDFIVTDNKKPQKILSFAAVGGNAVESARAEPPAKIILLVDEVNVGFDRVAYERDQIRKFAMQNDGKLPHPVTIAFFTDHGSEVANGSTQDGKQLLAAFDKHETSLRTMRRSQGFYGAVDRFQLSLSTLNSLAYAEAQKPGRKMLIWISPGWAYLSGPGIDLTQREEAGLFSSIVRTSNELRRARITLYSIDPLGVADAAGLRISYYEEFLKPVLKPNNAEAADLSLQVLATQTGGLVLNSSNDISAQIDRAVADADAYYTLTIDPTPSERPNEFHAIEVKVETPGLTARTRNGYYGQP